MSHSDKRTPCRWIMVDERDGSRLPRSNAGRVMRWRIMWLPRKLYPDLANSGSPVEERQAYSEASQELRWEPRSVKYWVACGIALVSVKPLYLAFGQPYFLPDAVYCGPLIFIGFVIGHHLLFGSHIRRALRRRLNEQGIPVCMTCGYSLVGNVSGLCPECGAPAATDPDDPPRARSTEVGE